MRNGYFSNNPLGLWVHTFVAYTPAAFNTADGRKTLVDLAKKNGLDLDGTPIINNVSDIDNLFKKGYITKQTRAQNAEGRYAICPVIKDPTNGGIVRRTNSWPSQSTMTARPSNDFFPRGLPEPLQPHGQVAPLERAPRTPNGLIRLS